MKFGVVYPQTELVPDPIAIRDYAQAVEALGFKHVLAYDHILGANPERPGGWQGPYTFRDSFMEPFTLFSYMAGATQRLGFATAILILPQRQTALVAKQAACLSILCGGRFRLGVGLGWNHVEYEALNQSFTNRGKRIEEQVELLRQLFREEVLDFQGKYEHIPGAGLNPLPPDKHIPIWFGSNAEQATIRAARIGDGWFPGYKSAGDAATALELVKKEREAAGKSMTDFGIEPRVSYGDGNPDRLHQIVEDWIHTGVTHMAFNTMGAGLDNVTRHIKALTDCAKLAGIS
jgi:probable F420-dependent oxidoreductase